MDSTDATIIVVDDEPGTRATLCGILMEDAGYKVIGLERGAEALEMIRKGSFDVVIADIRLPDVSGLEILEMAKEINPDAAVIMMTGYASMETAVDAVNQGAYAYFVKPVNPDELKTTIANALKQQRLSLENKRLVESLQRTNKLLLEANKELRNEIAERKQMEEALRKSEQELAIIFETSSDAIRLIDTDFNIVRINSAMEALSGLDSAASIGKKCFNVSKAAELCHTKECPLTRILKTKDRISDEAVVERQDGTQATCIVTSSPVYDEHGVVIGILEDFVNITERKQAEELYSTLAESSPVGVYIVQEGKYCFVNTQFQKHTGYSEDELLNMHPLEMIHPEDSEKVNQNTVEMLKGNILTPDEFRVINQDGDTRWAMRTLSSIYYKGKRATLGNFMDITERKQMEEELRLRAQLLDNASDSITLVDSDGNLLYVNEIFCKSHGYSREEAIGMNLRQLDIPGFDEIIESRTQEIREKGIAVFEDIHLSKDGSAIDVEVHSRFIESDNRELILSVERDITERKRMERELQERNEKLDAQNEELQSQAEELIAQQQELIEKTREVERANQLKSEFLANMSHELRTPLNVIIGFSELMADEVPGKINKKQKQCLNDVLTSSQHLLNLINGVLDLSRIEAGKVELKLKNVALTKMIASLTRTMMPILTPRKQSLDAEIEEGLPLVYVDEDKIAQVLLNLVDNASKFSPDGSKLKVKAVSKGDLCQVSVIDNGIGIRKEDQERVFEPFSRLNNPLVKERGGTGLGLALVKQIVERYGGLIWVESKHEKGSRFIFTVPLAKSG